MPQLIYFVVMLVLSYALQPKPPRPKPAAFEDFDFPTAEDGTPQIVVFGDVWLTDWTVIGVGNYRNQPIRKSTGGLFSKSVTSGYRYGMSILMGVCRGIDDLVEIKISDKTAWTGNIGTDNQATIQINQKSLFGGDDGEGGILGTLTVQRGAPDQPILQPLADMYGTVIQEGYYTSGGTYYDPPVWIPPVIEAANVPAYRGVVTFFFDGLICSNSPYPKPWSFRVRRTTSNWDGSVWYPSKAVISMSDDKIKAMNPAHIIYEAQTNRIWGRGFAASQLDLASFQSAADQLYSEGFGLCLAWRRQESLSEFIQQIVNTIGAAFYLDRMTGLWRIELVRDNYDVETLPFFDSSNGLLRIAEDNNSANDVASNQTTVTFRDPITNQDQPIRAENIAAIQKYGVISESKNYAGIATANLAGRVAARDMKIAQSGLKKFKLVFDRRAYQIQPMTVLKISAIEQGIESLVLRAIRVEHDSVTNGEITVTAVQDIFGLADQNFIGSQPSLHQDAEITAQPIIEPLIYEVPFFELLKEFSVADLQLNSGAYFAIAAKQPTSMHTSFDILAKAQSETAFVNVGSSDFAFIARITESMAQTATAIEVTILESITGNINVGDRGIIDDEIVRVDAVDINANTVTLARGCIDTVVQLHAVGAKLYIYSNISNAANRLFSVGETANLKFITHTSQDQLDEESTEVNSIGVSNRFSRPYPPAKVKFNSVYFPSETDVTDGLTVVWEHRNRLIQNSQAPSFIEASSIAEAGTTYNLKIFDANNAELLNKDAVESPYIWNVPRRFIGELETTLQINMTGDNNSRTFIDTSANTSPILNEGVIIKTDAAATGGSAAFFDSLWMQTAAHTSLNSTEDHTLEGRVKTPSVNNLASNDSGVWVITVGAVDGIYSEKYNINFAYNFGVGKCYIGIQGYYYNPVTDQLEDVNYSTEFTIAQDTYFDFAVEKIGDHLDIYVDGIKLGECNLSVIDSGTSTPKFLKLTAWNAKSSFMLNGLRMTKLIGGRYAANYTPAAYIIGASDPFWSNVVLLISMTGSEGSSSLSDSSTNNLVITNTATVMITNDSNAHGGSAARFCVPSLLIQNQSALKDKNFVIQFKVKFLSAGSDVTIFNLIESLRLDFLTLKNFDPTTGFTESVNFNLASITDGNYHDIRIERDASTGKVRFAVDDLFVDGTLNATSAIDGDLYIGSLNSSGMYLNSFKIQTVDGTEGTVPNVENPVRIELESERDNLKCHQVFTTKVIVI